jgi:class 3 adenylate cyclase
MVEANGDYYRRAVNVAARIAAQATPGCVFVGEAAIGPPAACASSASAY